MERFRRLLPTEPVVLNVGGTDAEVEAIGPEARRIDIVNYARDGVRFEAMPIRPDCYDGVYCAHTLEHVRNVGVFLDRIFLTLKPGGVLAIVVPPAKPNIVGGHLTLWNAGLLIYNLIRARFDCSKAMVRSEGYDIGVLVRKVRANFHESELREDAGDIEYLAPYFPLPVAQDFDGRIESINWE
jgi:SAM-dependent methyltransferase